MSKTTAGTDREARECVALELAQRESKGAPTMRDALLQLERGLEWHLRSVLSMGTISMGVLS